MKHSSRSILLSYFVVASAIAIPKPPALQAPVKAEVDLSSFDTRSAIAIDLEINMLLDKIFQKMTAESKKESFAVDRVRVFTNRGSAMQALVATYGSNPTQRKNALIGLMNKQRAVLNKNFLLPMAKPVKGVSPEAIMAINQTFKEENAKRMLMIDQFIALSVKKGMFELFYVSKNTGVKLEAHQALVDLETTLREESEIAGTLNDIQIEKMTQQLSAFKAAVLEKLMAATTKVRKNAVYDEFDSYMEDISEYYRQMTPKRKSKSNIFVETKLAEGSVADQIHSTVKEIYAAFDSELGFAVTGDFKIGMRDAQAFAEKTLLPELSKQMAENLKPKAPPKR